MDSKKKKLKEKNNIRNTNSITNQCEDIHKHKLEELLARIQKELKRSNELASTKGSSNWLNLLPLKSEGYNLNKREFFDALLIRYRWTLKQLPTDCACGKKFNIDHVVTCMKGGFIHRRHDEFRNIALRCGRTTIDAVNGRTIKSPKCKYRRRSSFIHTCKKFLDAR